MSRELIFTRKQLFQSLAAIALLGVLAYSGGLLSGAAWQTRAAEFEEDSASTESPTAVALMADSGEPGTQGDGPRAPAEASNERAFLSNERTPGSPEGHDIPESSPTAETAVTGTAIPESQSPASEPPPETQTTSQSEVSPVPESAPSTPPHRASSPSSESSGPWPSRPESSRAPVKARTPDAVSEEGVFELQIGAFAVESNAFELVSDLEARGYEPYLVSLPGRGLTTVRLGAWETRYQALAVAERLVLEMGRDSFVKKRE